MILDPLFHLFGISVALSADGLTLAVGSIFEDDAAQDVVCDSTNPTSTTCTNSGAVYMFKKTPETGAVKSNVWLQQVKLKASNAGLGDRFSDSVALSADGRILAVGAGSEGGAQRGVLYRSELDPTTQPLGDAENAYTAAGAVYLYRQLNSIWLQQPHVYVKASNTEANDVFGSSVALSADGQTLAVGAIAEDGGGLVDDCGAIGETPLPNPETNCLSSSGAVYLY